MPKVVNILIDLWREPDVSPGSGVKVEQWILDGAGIEALSLKSSFFQFEDLLKKHHILIF